MAVTVQGQNISMNIFISGLIVLAALAFGQFVVAAFAAAVIGGIAVTISSRVRGATLPPTRQRHPPEQIADVLSVKVRATGPVVRRKKSVDPASRADACVDYSSALIVDEPWISLILTGRKT